MNKVLRNQLSGLTLTELLVSVILVGVVMVGVISMDFAMRSSKETTSDYTNMVMKLQAAMMYIEKAAMKVTGDASAGDHTSLGIFTYKDPPQERNSICFRYDVLGTLHDYSDDKYECITHGGSYNLHRHPDRDTICHDSITCGAAANKELLTAISDEASFKAVNTDSQEYFVNGGTFDYLEVTLSSCVDNTQPIHPIKNPEYTLTTRISPPGISR